MTVVTFPDYSTLCRAVVNHISDYLRKKPASLVCLASGHSPLGVFSCLADDVRAGRLDVSNCEWVGLDEWLGMNGNDPGSCRQMMDEFLFRPLHIAQQKIHFFDGRADDPEKEVDRINKLIAANNGLDIMLAGIGTNGHIAMNEPGTPFGIHAHVSVLAEETIAVGQKYFTIPTPLAKGITLGVADFANARLAILMASGATKAAVVKRVLQEQPGEHLPASVIHRLSQGLLMADHAACPG